MITLKQSGRQEALIERILREGETQNFETKRVSGKMVGKALETICAFANTRGGWLVLGVEDFSKAKGADRFFGTTENPEAVDELLRKLETRYLPPIENVVGSIVKTTLRDGSDGQIVALYTPPSDKVHSVVDNGTWMRANASNREMNAAEIAELSYRRGVRSAESEAVDVDFELLETDTWRLYLRGRGLSATGIADQLYRTGLAKKVGGVIRPTRAAVLLFAEEPGSLLAALGTRADVRVFHYKGNKIESGEVPNLRKHPKTLRGPIYKLIESTWRYLLDEISEGLTLASSGFRTVHRYPVRVLKEAVTNALIHRDYRLNRDTHVLIFDNRIEIMSPGLFPGKITPASVHRSGSFARNVLIASNLREFPDPPNVDAGEGVKMMFALMQKSGLFPPMYRELREHAQEAVVVSLSNEEQPPVWTQVSDWIDREGPISNSVLCEIAGLDTLKASKLLKKWVAQGLLVADQTRAKRNMVYSKSDAEGYPNQELLSFALDNNGE